MPAAHAWAGVIAWGMDGSLTLRSQLCPVPYSTSTAPDPVEVTALLDRRSGVEHPELQKTYTNQRHSRRTK
jgi:hypothetical protein